jgi:hypothetical protein
MKFLKQEFSCELWDFVRFYNNIMLSGIYRKKCSETKYTWDTVKYINGGIIFCSVPYPVCKRKSAFEKENGKIYIVWIFMYIWKIVESDY